MFSKQRFNLTIFSLAHTLILETSELEALSVSTLTYGHFNTIHPGHIRFLRKAASLGRPLAVAVQRRSSNEENLFSQLERCEALSLLGMADYIIKLEENEIDYLIAKLEPKTFALGDFKKGNDELFSALKLQKKSGRKVTYHPGSNYGPTADLIGNSEIDLRTSRLKEFVSACKKQNVQISELRQLVLRWKSSKLITIGDTIVDEYTVCEALGLSAEAPVVVVRELKEKKFVGGAGVVAAHIKALGASVQFVSVIGDDDIGRFVRSETNKNAISCHLIVDKSRPTTYKKRYMVDSQKLFRVTRVEDHHIDEYIETQVIEKVRELAQSSQGIVVSDFSYGLLTPKVIEVVQRIAHSEAIPLFGDVQCSSQFGVITRMKNYTLICPNEREARMALQDKNSSIELVAQRLLKVTKAQNMILKLGPHGFIVYTYNNQGQVKSQPFPALTTNPLDVTGAGDSLLSLMSVAMSCKQSVMHAAALGCCISALAVENLGNNPISSSAILDYLDRIEDIWE